MTFPKSKLDERTWLAEDASQRDAIGSSNALEIGDECITETNGFRFRSVSVDGANASTWVKTGADCLVDTLLSPITTGNATASGGTVDFSILVGDANDSFAKCVLNQLLLVANGTCADATVRFFRDAARSDQIYEAANVDPSTAFADRDPAHMRGDDGSLLENNTLYGRVINNDAGDSTFDVGVELWG